MWKKVYILGSEGTKYKYSARQNLTLVDRRQKDMVCQRRVFLYTGLQFALILFYERRIQ